MSSALAQKVRDNYEELFPQSKEATFSRRSQSAWANLTSEINAEFGSSISEKQCKDKWHNLKKIAKRENADEQKTSCRLKLRRIATAILAAAVLHNIAIEMRLPEPPATEESNENDDLNEINEDENRNVLLNDRQARQAGIEKRQELVARFT
ncbi:hypothetical protein niasHT_024846 [Heterodera trifolii]|uniref:Myb/SANT-like DNA-binding domain-containing protein n=1 Tax=Heterodera trifolii TaxID=157864 RepID=A0ABD2JWE6_9BILA